MDAFTQLALMAKAKRVFESADTFLSFPATQLLSYKPEDLTFGSAATLTGEMLKNMSEFARGVNKIPRGVLAPVEEEEGSYLWDVYGDVLETAEVAAGSISADDKARYDQAIAFLYETSDDGIRRDSAALTTYKQYRDAYFETVEDYKSQESTAKSSSAPEVQKKWKTTDEPRLRTEVDRAKNEWATTGQQTKVEKALQSEQVFAARMPLTTWNDWKSSFNPDIDMLTDTSQNDFALTGFSPVDALDLEWSRFTMTAAEMKELAKSAPAELVRIFGSSVPDGSIESVSFEYRSVSLLRPWFKSDLFKSRFWRLWNGAEPLSNGSLSDGRCPAYVTALVFARNVKIQTRPQAGQPARTNPPVPAKLFNPSILRVARLQPPRVATPVARVTATRTVAARTSTPQVSRVTSASLKNMSFVAVRKPTVRPVLSPVAAMRVATPAARPRTETRPTESNPEVMVLAFICKLLPKSCPDPDPALTWE